jgi:hypothetical protein
MKSTIFWDVMLCSMVEATLNNVLKNDSVWVVLLKIKAFLKLDSLYHLFI